MKFKFLILIFTLSNFNFSKPFVLKNTTKSTVRGKFTHHILERVNSPRRPNQVKKIVDEFVLEPNKQTEFKIDIKVSNYGVRIFAEISDEVFTVLSTRWKDIESDSKHSWFQYKNYSGSQLNSDNFILAIVQPDKDKIEIIQEETKSAEEKNK